MARVKKIKKRMSLKELRDLYFNDKRFGVLATLIINIVTVAGSISILYLTKENRTIKLIFLTLLVLYAVIAVSILIHLSCIELKYFSEKYIDVVDKFELKQALPETFIFRNRKDVFVVNEQGDAELTWDFEIEKVTNNNLSFISIPVVCEYVSSNHSKNQNEDNIEQKEKNTAVLNELNSNGDSNGDAESKEKKQQVIEIKEFCVNGITQTNYQYVHFSTDYKGDRPIEKGMIRIPLFTASTKGGIENITLKVNFKGMFKNFEKMEYIIVDIPYITKKISVVVKHEDNNRYDINVIDNYFDVRELYSDTFDAGEVAKQLNNCSIIHSAIDNNSNDKDYLLWESDFPKLGYRYKITFNFIDRQQKNKKDDYQ